MLKTLSLIFTLSLFISTAQATTNFSGQIRTNTTWTKAGSPYILSGLIEIAPDVTLTLEPGVVLKIQEDIRVYGYIVAIGNANDSIHIERMTNASFGGDIWFSNNPTTSDASKFKYCSIYKNDIRYTDTFKIVVENSFLHKSSIYGGRGGLIANNNLLYESAISSYSQDSFIAIGNTVINGSIACSATPYINISNNNLNGYVPAFMANGIYCADAGVRIMENNIVNSTNIGIWLHEVTLDLDGKSSISGNIITGNYIGMYVTKCSGIIQNNTVYDNHRGLQYGGKPRLGNDVEFINNCSYDNKYNFYNDAPENYEVGKNWWGTTDSATIESLFYDVEDDFKVGDLTFKPALTSKPSSCKTVSPPTEVEVIKVANTSISAYPNPFNSTLSFDATENIKEVVIYNIVGKHINTTHPGKTKKAQISTVNFAPGIYMYRATLEDGATLTGKIVKR